MFAQWRQVFSALGFADDGSGGMRTTIAGRPVVVRRRSLHTVSLTAVAQHRSTELPWDVDVQTAGAAMLSVAGPSGDFAGAAR